MPQFMLLLHGNPADFQELSPEDMQRIIERYTAWSERLAAAGPLRRFVRGRLDAPADA